MNERLSVACIYLLLLLFNLYQHENSDYGKGKMTIFRHNLKWLEQNEMEWGRNPSSV